MISPQGSYGIVLISLRECYPCRFQQWTVEPVAPLPGEGTHPRNQVDSREGWVYFKGHTDEG